MATLQFKGKSAVWNHHLSVPYQTLDPVTKMSLKGTDADENIIIEGDNLVALKSLLPKYQGRVKCIYIDPPYNTGNEEWVYNDNVNNPLIKEWLGDTVGKEGEDLTRHDKWLCMMTPRLKLLRELLADDGVIFVSIDENEFAILKLLLDEIFEGINFIGMFSVENNPKGRKNGKFISVTNEYCLVYAKNIEYADFSKIIPKHSADMAEDENGDFVRRSGKRVLMGENTLNKLVSNFASSKHYSAYIKDSNLILRQESKISDIDEDLLKKGYKRYITFRDGLFVENTYTKEKLKELFDIKALDIRDEKIYEKHFSDMMQIKSMLTNNEYEAIVDNKKITYKIDLKSTSAKQQLTELLGGEFFDFPKNVSFIKHLLLLNSDPSSIILDSFAGSGTTAQAVLELNKEDGGNRKFILVQIPESTPEDSPAYQAGYKAVQEITQARVSKVIERDSLDVGFTYYKLGKRIDAESILGGDLPIYEEFAKYVYYLATGKNFPEKSKVSEKKSFVGNAGNDAVFLIYEQDFEKLKGMALTLDIAKKMNDEHSGRKIVYAPACFLDEEHLEQYNITFVGIPFNLFERK